MRIPELNEMCQSPRPSFHPGPNEAYCEEFATSVGGSRSSRVDWYR